MPNHLTEQWGADFLRLYPNANVLVATKKDFEPSNRKKFCSRIATGDYDAIIIGHSQFERIPLSPERQKSMIERQIQDITFAIAEAKAEDDGKSFTVKQMEKTKKTLQAKLQKLNDQSRKDDVVTFEQLGVDRLFVDESHFYKNMFLYTKMRNIAGIAQTDAQKSSDMFAKCQYLDEITGGKGVTFATGTPVSNSMVELYAKRKNLLMGSNPIIAPDSEMLWNAAIVWRILRRYEYTGALVMGRRKKIDVNTTSVRTLPEDKWIIAENAHAAIVTKDEYYQAQKAIRNVTPIQYKVGDDFALKGKICCGNCNRQLRHERQYGEMVFYCGYKRSAGKFSKCYGGYYREYSVNAKVARAIKTVFYALDVVNQGMQEKQSITVRCMDIEDLEKQAEAIRVEQIKLYESYADGVLLRDAYIEKKKALSEKLAALQDSIRTEKEEQECADELDEEIRALTKQASEKTYIGGLTKECVDAFVSMVYLYDDQTMKIEFNCEDVIRRALEKYGA